MFFIYFNDFQYSAAYSIPVPIENVRKPKVFWPFQGVRK